MEPEKQRHSLVFQALWGFCRVSPAIWSQIFNPQTNNFGLQTRFCPQEDSNHSVPFVTLIFFSCSACLTIGLSHGASMRTPGWCWKASFWSKAKGNSAPIPFTGPTTTWVEFIRHINRLLNSHVWGNEWLIYHEVELTAQANQSENKLCKWSCLVFWLIQLWAANSQALGKQGIFVPLWKVPFSINPPCNL